MSDCTSSLAALGEKEYRGRIESEEAICLAIVAKCILS